MVEAPALPHFIINDFTTGLSCRACFATATFITFCLSITSTSCSREIRTETENVRRLLIELALLAADKGKGKGRKRRSSRDGETQRRKGAKKKSTGSPSSGSSVRDQRHSGAPSSLPRLFISPRQKTANEPCSAAHLDPRYSTISTPDHDPRTTSANLACVRCIASHPTLHSSRPWPHLLLPRSTSPPASSLTDCFAVLPPPPRDSARQSPDLTCARDISLQLRLSLSTPASSRHACLPDKVVTTTTR